MKKKLLLSISVAFIACTVNAQDDKTKYPEPEFSNEVYLLKKENTFTVMRLEKGSSKMDTKTKLGGMAGAESAYLLEGETSTARLNSGSSLSFIYSTGAGEKKSSPQMDSMMRANGVDSAIMSGYGTTMDPSSMITLYKVETDKGSRKILLMKSPGAMPFGSKKMKSSDKYTFSVKKIKDGYWELVVDKTLPKGEYAFSVMSMGMGNMDGSTLMFAFGVD